MKAVFFNNSKINISDIRKPRRKTDGALITAIYPANETIEAFAKAKKSDTLKIILDFGSE